MNHAIGDYNIRGSVSEGKMQIIADGAGPAAAFDGEAQRNAAPIQTDAANAALREKAENTTWSAADVQNQRSRIESLDQIRERGRDDGADVLRRCDRRPVEGVLVVKSLLFSCGHFSIPARARNSLPSVR